MRAFFQCITRPAGKRKHQGKIKRFTCSRPKTMNSQDTHHPHRISPGVPTVIQLLTVISVSVLWRVGAAQLVAADHSDRCARLDVLRERQVTAGELLVLRLRRRAQVLQRQDREGRHDNQPAASHAAPEHLATLLDVTHGRCPSILVYPSSYRVTSYHPLSYRVTSCRHLSYRVTSISYTVTLVPH